MIESIVFLLFVFGLLCLMRLDRKRDDRNGEIDFSLPHDRQDKITESAAPSRH